MKSSLHLLPSGLNSDVEGDSIRKYLSSSAKETYNIGFELGKTLPINTVVCFFGNLGAGKTTFIKGLVAGALGSIKDEVNSPTFTYLNIYHGIKMLYHFDLYRLRDVDEFLSMGFDEMFDAGGICCIEWSEKIVSIIPLEAIQIEMIHLGGDERQITVSRMH